MHPGPNHPPPYVMLQDQGHPGPHGRNPPRFNGQYRPNGHRKSSCLRCYCCCYCCIFITLVVIIAAVVISLIIINPSVPKYSINDFSVKAFNVTPDFNLHAQFMVTVKAVNPNKKISIIYEKGSIVQLKYSGMKLCTGVVPHFRQPTSNTTMINVNLNGDLKGNDFQGSTGESLMEKIKSSRVPLTVSVRVPVNVGLGKYNMLLNPIGIYVDASMVVNNLSQPDKKVQISDTKYDFNFGFKFKK
ncbi:NDR1/HIN1-like protein 6 [Pyrus x bretschneideri]|uniref:NDR1/HIN1-like protein 6 n=1 Tax=Pyrus x bretschneideri TaxID=225117 RepID=UPI00203089D8|nr:NDR1/HIN1-like protein 6 [Pyrus x bretschneideri]